MERNELQKRLEENIMYKQYTANVPVAVYKEQKQIVDDFCKEHFMDNRWSMIWNLVVDATQDYKYKMLYDELLDTKAEVQEIRTMVENKPIETKTIKTFGAKK